MSEEWKGVIKHFTLIIPAVSVPKDGPARPGPNPQPATRQVPADAAPAAAVPADTASGHQVLLVWLKGKRWTAINWGRCQTDSPMRLRTSRPPKNDKVVALATRLLEIAGFEADIPSGRFGVGRLLREGVLTDSWDVLEHYGPGRRVRENCALVWQTRPDEYRIHVGFGQDDDAVWRRHAWLVDRDGRVVETTDRKNRYFGRPLSPDEVARFCDWCGRGR